MKTGSPPQRTALHARRIALSLALLALRGSLSWAADFQISASLDKSRVALNEQVILSLTISGSGNRLPEPHLPAIPNFQVYNAGRSQNFSWVNGQASASVIYNYLLTPLREGQYKIPAIQVDYQGQTAQTQELPLEVVKGEPSAVQGSARVEGVRPAPAPGSAAIFITGTVDKTSVVVGEPVIYTFRVYNRVALLRQPAYQPPDMQGFWSEDLPPQRNFQSAVKGVPYQVTEVRTALFPTAPGRAKIGSAELRVMMESVGTDPFSPDFFATFFGRGEEKTLRTDPVAVTVRPLPDPKPAAFKGAVGQYALSAALDKERTTVGQPVTLTVTISGKGNIKALPDIVLPPLTNFRTLSDNAGTNIEKTSGEVRGSKVFKTVLIPTASGDLQVPAISYVYFDTQENAYKTIASRAFTLKVTPGATGSSLSSSPNSPLASSPAAGIQRLGEDIRYIRTPGDIATQGLPLYRRGWFRWLHGLALLALAGYGVFLLALWLFFSNEALARFRSARSRALNEMARADKALAESNTKQAAGILAGTLQRYLADKLSLDSRELAMRQVMDALLARGVSEHSGQKIRALWESFDLFRFAPAQVRPEELAQAREKLGQIVESLEKEIVWKG